MIAYLWRQLRLTRWNYEKTCKISSIFCFTIIGLGRRVARALDNMLVTLPLSELILCKT